MKKNDIYSMYNDIDEMIKSIDIKNEDIIDSDDVVFIDDEIESELSDKDNKSINGDLEDSNIDDEPYDINKAISAVDEMFDDKKEELIIEKKIKKEENKKEKKKTKIKKIKDKKKKKNYAVAVIIFAILDFIALVCLFLMYGPISYFRSLWVTSAMTTMNHRYFAYIFFNEATVNKIMNENGIVETGDQTNEDDINFNNKDNGKYDSIYEEQVLKREKGNNLYKVFEVKGDGYVGHMLVVYDPSNVFLTQAKTIKYGGRQLEKMLKEANAVAGINASGFSRLEDGGLVPTGIVIIDGKIIYDNGSTGWGGGIIGFNNNNILVLTKRSASEAVKMGIRDAVSFGPFLIVNGERSIFKGNGGYGVAPRTAIGQRKDGIVLMLVIDGRRPGHSIGVDMVELTNIMEKYGAYNAANLDGGGSSSIVVNNEVLSIAGGFGYDGERYLPNAWAVADK